MSPRAAAATASTPSTRWARRAPCRRRPTANPINVLPGFPTGLGEDQRRANFYPFGLFFANANTLYVADEGDGAMADAATDPNAGLEKWSLFNGSKWMLDYTLQNGLNLGMQYTVADPTDPTATYTTATDGLRNITGKVNGDGTVTLFGVTSTVSTSGDQGADPNKLVAITDNLCGDDPAGRRVVHDAGDGRLRPGAARRGLRARPPPSPNPPRSPCWSSRWPAWAWPPAAARPALRA